GTTTPPTTPLKPPTTAAISETPNPQQLNDQAWSLMQQGRYAAALPLLERAVPALRGAGPADPAEGYANYNLGYTLLQLGRCAEAQPYLQHAQELDRQRREVASALAAVQQCLAPAAPPKHEKHGPPPGHGPKHKKHGDDH